MVNEDTVWVERESSPVFPVLLKMSSLSVGALS